jgi:hypothetical protein
MPHVQTIKTLMCKMAFCGLLRIVIELATDYHLK